MVERERGGSVKDRIKRMVIEDPGINFTGITDRLKRGGDKVELPSEMLIESVRSDTRQTLRLLADMGLLSSKVKIPRRER